MSDGWHRACKEGLSQEISSILRKDARVPDYQRLIVEEFENRVVRSAPQIRRAGVDETSILESATFTEPEDAGRPVRGIMLALILGLAFWAAIGVIVAAAIALF